MNATGKVIKGRVEFDGEPLPDGAEVVVLCRHSDEEVELSEEEAVMLDEAIREAEADPAGGVSWHEFRRQYREGR
jgi:hypothetical protein